MAKTELALIAVLLVAVVACARPAWRQPIARSIWLFLAVLAISMTIRLDAVSDAIDSAVGVAAFAVLLKHLTGIVAVACLLDAAFHASREHLRPLGTRHLPMLAAAVWLIVFFPHTTRDTSADFTDQAAGQFYATMYQLGWLAALGYAMGAAMWWFHKAVRTVQDRLLKTGIQTMRTGLALGVLYAACRAGYFLARLWLADPHDGLMATLTDAVKYLGIVLITTGFGIAAVARHRQSRRIHRQLRRLEPMWHSLASIRPTIDLPELTIRERLTRRTVEIRDALVLLRPYTSRQTRDQAAQLLRAQGIAHAGIAADVVAWRQALNRRGPRPIPSGDPISLPSFGECAAEQAWQNTLAAHWNHPAVHQVIRSLHPVPGQQTAPPTSGHTQQNEKSSLIA